MTFPPIDVTAKGAVRLGHEVTCDGFVHGVPYRIQTHVHDDHMDGFESSKGYQDIFMSTPTKELLIAAYDADLPYRSNIIGLDTGTPYQLNDIAVEMLANGHILGSVQTAVTLSSGLRVGYSGDFQWPMDAVLQVDALVVDSTYGSPDSNRHHDRKEVGERFIELVVAKIKEGPVFIKGDRGVIERAMELLDDIVLCPLIGSESLCREIEVYRHFGYAVGDVLDIRSVAGREAMKDNRYIRFYSKGDGFPDDPTGGSTIKLKAFMPRDDEPVYIESDHSFTVAMSNHADFDGTLEYVRATGARYVVTDASRNGRADELAKVLKTRLGIEARPSTHEVNRSWGT